MFKATFVGHPLLDQNNTKKISLNDLIKLDKKIISVFPGSRLSEVNMLMPILLRFILLTKKVKNDYVYIFHTTKELKNIVNSFLLKVNFSDCEIISDENIKQEILPKSYFAIAKSGTISIEICNAKVPSIIIYKINFLNYFIIKLLAKVKYANIFNIIANSEVIPELLQSECNESKIYEIFDKYISNPELRESQILNCNRILATMRTKISSSEKVANILNEELKNT